MLDNVIMRGKDAISAKLAECFLTVGGRRYNFMQMVKFEAKFNKSKTTIPILGRTGQANKSTGWNGTFSAAMHYNQSILRQMMVDYKDTGDDVYFEIQVTNEDPTSAAGRQTMIFVDCNIDGGILAKFDADGEYLDEDVDGTFEDFRMNEKFNELPGM